MQVINILYKNPRRNAEDFCFIMVYYESNMASLYMRKNIWKLMLDIRPSKSRALHMPYGKRIQVDFASDVLYKEKDLRIGTIDAFAPTQQHMQSRLLREHEDLEHILALLELKNRGARFVVRVPRISLD